MRSLHLKTYSTPSGEMSQEEVPCQLVKAHNSPYWTCHFLLLNSLVHHHFSRVDGSTIPTHTSHGSIKKVLVSSLTSDIIW